MRMPCHGDIMATPSDWSIFYGLLNKFGARLIRGVHPQLADYIKMAANDSDACWSEGLEAAFQDWETNPDGAIEDALTYWVENAKEHLQAILGPDSLVPWEHYGTTQA